MIDLIESAARNYKTNPLNLGAVAGSGGGVGGPPGGYIGWLPQTRVAYDEDEFATLTTSGVPSLLDNLNHLRYRLNILESGGSIIIEDDNTSSSYSDTTNLHFVGSGVIVTDLGGGEVQVQINATGSGGGGISDAPSDGNTYGRNNATWVVVSGGSGTSLTVEDYDGSPLVTNVDTILFSGATVTNLGSGDVLVSFSGGGSEDILHYYNDDLSTQPGMIYTTTKVYASGTLRVYYNGLRQRKNVHYVEVTGFTTFSTYFTTYSGDVVIADYDYYLSSQSSSFGLIDSDGITIVDSDGIEITESI
jgi:hypothetical protein